MVLPGNYRLEAIVSSKHPAFVGSFGLHGSPEFTYLLRLDAKWERDGIHQIQSGGEPFAVGKPTRCFPANPALTILNDLQLAEVMAGVTYLHELGVVHRDLKGVLSNTGRPFVSH